MEEKKLRLVLFEECNRSCEGCCNKDYNLNHLPTIWDFSEYDKIFLTGGEPMLQPDLILSVIQGIRSVNDCPIYMYTAKSKRAMDLIAMLHVLDGITLTLHETYDVAPFVALNNLLVSMDIKGKSLRLNVFSGVDISGLNTDLWEVKDNIEWIVDCPLPVGETLGKLW